MYEVAIVVLSFLIHSTNGLADCGEPSYSMTVDQSCNKLESITPPASTTEGATIHVACASLLIRTKAPIDYCPVMVCEDTGNWRPAQISCGGATECYNSSEDYQGRRTCTSSGRMCQRWDSQSPHTHSYTENSMFPNDNITESANYCRDPDEAQREPWCYTTDPAVPWESCDIPHCTNITIDQGDCPNNYCGDPVSGISTDNGCSKITLVTDGERNIGSTKEYKCYSLLLGFTSIVDYCPVKRCQADTYWTSAAISCGENECYGSGQSQLYQGRRTCTQTGIPCQRWDSHNYTTGADFPEGDVSLAGSYCRDPGGAEEQPWCYTTTAGEWDYCGVLNCAPLQVNHGSCATPAPITTSTSQPTSTPILTPTSTSSSTSTTASPAAGETEVTNRYHRINADTNGFEKLSTIPFVRNAIACARICSEHLLCVFLTFEINRTCILYREEIPSITNIPCTTVKCYMHESLM